MLQVKCPTCGKSMADKQIPFEEGLEKICQNPKLSEKQKDEAKRELVNSMGLERYCCKTRLISYVDLAQIVI